MPQARAVIVGRDRGRIRRHVVAIPLLIALGAACGSSSSAGKQTASSTASPSSPTTRPAGTAQNPAFVDIVTCDNAGGNGDASGTVENQGSTATAYRLQLGFYDSAGNKLLASGSADTATIPPGASGDWQVTVSGLGGADVVCHTVSIDTLSGGASGTTTTPTTGSAAAEEFPCDLLTQAEIDEIAGNPLDPGDASTNHVTEDTTQWTARACDWGKLGASEPTEVTLAVSRAADFPSGSVQCPAPPGTSTAVAGLGTSATWAWTDAGTSITVGKLRVCAADALVDVTVSGAGSGAALLAVAKGVAGKVLAAL